MRTDALIIEGPDGFDPTAEVCGYPMMHRQVKAMVLARPFRVLIAGDKGMAPVIKKCTRLGADFLYPGILASSKLVDVDSLTRGLTYLKGKCDSVMITPANYPFINTETYKTVLDSDAEITVAAYNGKRGWPVLITTAMIDEAIQLSDISTLLSIHSEKLSEIETADVGVITDVCAEDFTEELGEELSNSHSLHRLHSMISPVMSREEPFFGRGIMQILRLVDETSAMTEVWRMMGMAATHGWKIMNRARDFIGEPMLETVRKPATGTLLTPEGRRYMEKYARWYERSEAFAQQVFDEEFAEDN